MGVRVWGGEGEGGAKKVHTHTHTHTHTQHALMPACKPQHACMQNPTCLHAIMTVAHHATLTSYS